MSRRSTFGRRSPNPFAAPRQDGGIMRLLGRVIIGVIVAVAIYLIVDFAGRVWAEAYVANEVQQSLGLSGKPDVTFGGPLFLPQLLSGTLASAKANSQEFTSNGISFTQAFLQLNDIDFSPGKLLLHKDSAIVAHSGSGTVTMTSKQLSDAFHQQGIPVDLRFQDDGTVRISASQFPATAVVEATIVDGKLVLRPTNPILHRFSFPLELPELVPGLTYTKIDFGGTLGTLAFRLKDATFAIPAS